MKGQGIHTLTLVIMIVIFLFAAVAIYLAWLSATQTQVSEASCKTQLINYCTQWSLKGFSTSNTPDIQIPPNCSQYNVPTNPTQSDCTSILNPQPAK